MAKLEKVVVLGAGLIGNAIAKTLSQVGHQVTSLDFNEENLKSLSDLGIATRKCDATDNNDLVAAIGDCSFVVNALPGAIGYSALAACIEQGLNVADISFCPEDMRELGAAAKKSGSVVIADIGFAPGLSNMFVAQACREIEKTDSVSIYVGGLPVERTLPYEYKAVFSPADVIEEYTRPARFKIENQIIEKEALTDVESIEFAGEGIFEAFNTDGLRSLLSLPVPTLIEKTVRYPGHADKVRLLRETGLFNEEPIEVNGAKVSPRALTSSLLFDLWKYEKGDDDISLLRVVAEGDNSSIVYELIDRYDPKTELSSMARTTGFTACAALQMLIDEEWKEAGVVAPEELPSSALSYVEGYLKPLGVSWSKAVK